MRYLIYPAVFALLAPLSACYVGNTPPRSRAADAGVRADTAPTEDAGFTITRECETDDDCGDNARCERAPTVWFCVMNPPPVADAGAPADAPPTPEQCRALCEGRFCGAVHHAECGDVECGQCSSGHTCDEESGQCVITPPPPPPPPDTRPRWTVRVTGARVTACNTDWDRCTAVRPPLCTPTRPDPVVRVQGRATPEASNTCNAGYGFDVGNYLADELAAGLRVEVIDNDSPLSNHVSGDTICAPFSASFTAEDLAVGRKTFACSGGAVDVTLTPAR